MKSKLSEHTLPSNGSVKTIVKRAWLPKRVANVRIWLEQYEELYVYEERNIESNIITNDGKKAVFIVGNWVKVSEKLIKWAITTIG
jgi:hypothetical protein